MDIFATVAEKLRGGLTSLLPGQIWRMVRPRFGDLCGPGGNRSTPIRAVARRCVQRRTVNRRTGFPKRSGAVKDSGRGPFRRNATCSRRAASLGLVLGARFGIELHCGGHSLRQTYALCEAAAASRRPLGSEDRQLIDRGLRPRRVKPATQIFRVTWLSAWVAD